MSVLSEAFKLVCLNDPSSADIDAYLEYIRELDYEGVPGKKRFMNLRGVSTNVAYIRLLRKMLDIAESSGGEAEYSLKGVAEQLGHLMYLRVLPTWTPNGKPSADTDWKSCLIREVIVHIRSGFEGDFYVNLGDGSPERCKTVLKALGLKPMLGYIIEGTVSVSLNRKEG